MSERTVNNDVVVYVMLRAGSYIPVRISRDKLRQTMELFIAMLNDLENKVHKYFLAETAGGFPVCILMKEVIGYYTVSAKPTAQDRMAKALEKHLTEGEDWKSDE